MGDHTLATSAPTQSAHPWRATLRTVFAFVVALAAGLPMIVDASGLSEATPGIATAVAVGGAVTRILALPVVNAALATYAPWLSANGRDGAA